MLNIDFVGKQPSRMHGKLAFEAEWGKFVKRDYEIMIDSRNFIAGFREFELI